LLDVNARISRGKNRISNGCYFPIRTTSETAHHPRRTATPFMGLCDCWTHSSAAEQFYSMVM
jgi:hypothetical protein